MPVSHSKTQKLIHIMKGNRIILTAIWALIVLAFFACEQEIDPVNPIGGPDQSGVPADNNSLFANSSVRDRVRGNGMGGAMGFIYGRFLQNGNGRTASVVGTMKSYMSNDLVTANARTAEDSLNNENDCFIETYTETASTYEYTLDFGTGCEFDGEFFKGRLVERGSFTDNTFQSEVVFTDFGGREWEIDGTETYEGSWTNLDPDNEEPTEDDWSTEYTYTSDLTESFTENNTTVEISFQASGSERWDQNGYTVISATESGSTSNGESFQSTVDTPLFMDFSCEEDEVFIFVSGFESGSYTWVDDNGDEVSGSYSIDFGDGTCDNLITVTEDGVSETIDVSEEWGIDCEEGHDDDEWDDDEWEDDEDEFFTYAFYEIDRELQLTADESAFSSGKITFEIDTAELVTVRFTDSGAKITTADEALDARYEIEVLPTKGNNCDYYTEGVLVFYSEEGKAIVDFTNEQCTNGAYIYFYEDYEEDGDDRDDEEDEEDEDEDEEDEDDSNSGD